MDTVSERSKRTSESQGDDLLLVNRMFTPLLSKWVPPVPLDSERPYIPVDTAPWLSRVFFSWLLPVLRVGYKRTIRNEDMWKLTEKYKVAHNYDKFMVNLEKQHKQHKEWPKNAILWTIFYTYKYECFMALILKCCSILCELLTPLLTKYLIGTIQVGDEFGKGIGYAFGLTALIFLNGLFSNHSFVYAFIVGAHTRTVLTKALLEKSISANSETKHEFPEAKVISFLSADITRLETALQFSMALLSFPLAMAVALVILITNLGVSALSGIAVFFLLLVLMVLPSKLMLDYRVKANVHTDERVSALRELLQSMKMIKFYSWEDAYENLVKMARDKEMAFIYKTQIVIAVFFGFMMSCSGIVSMTAFLVQYAVRGGGSAAVIFSSLSMFTILSMTVVEVSYMIPMALDAITATTRLQHYLGTTNNKEENVLFYSKDIPDEKTAIKIRDGEFQWQVYDDKEEPQPKKSIFKSVRPPVTTTTITYKTVLKDISFDVLQGEFVVITGLTGSGKSSLLLALSGMIHRSKGSIAINGKSLLCGTPWVQNATVRENILFGDQYNSSKYKDVVAVCALDADVRSLPAGDMTEIGERGVTLSGGQRARLNLARAVYRDADIYLFDDILSAVDANVGKHITEKCLLGYLGSKTRVLATHNLDVVRRANRVIFIKEDGTAEVGTHSELKSSCMEFRNLMKFKKDDSDVKYWNPDKINPTEEKEEKEGNTGDGSLVEDEERAVNSIPMSIYYKYFYSGRGFFGLAVMPLLVSSTALAIFSSLFTNVWLSFWIDHKFDISTGMYIGLYVMFNFLTVILVSLELGILGYVTATASKVLNGNAVHRVLHTPMYYLDVTPIGRVLNRFSKDVLALDTEVSLLIKIFTHSLADVLGILILSIVYVPWFALAVPFIVVAFVSMTNIYQATAREVKRLEALKRSFIFNNFNEIQNGLTTIKSFDSEGRFIAKNDRLVDELNEVFFVVLFNRQWINFSLNTLSGSIVLIVTLLIVCGVFNLSAASAGLLTGYIISFSGVVTGLLNIYTQLENEMNSVERVYHFAFHLEQEADYRINGRQAAPGWPSEGRIKFENVSMSYRPGLPLTLKNISFYVGSSCKIGICGRTGAGKSSLMNALFRITELDEGKILIDDVDISQLGLHDLRSRLSIIPQDPVLFKGTIRRNLDPFHEKEDEQLWNALKRGGIIKADQELEGCKFHLDATVENEGSNFSLGERQLIALARALVRDSKILVLDEATSSVDYETDSLVQKTIAREFQDCTVLCIAHRLKTILNYDRILVLEEGQVEEFGSPRDLWNRDGLFRQMCSSAGIVEADFD